ncbi:hypothetical protein ACFZDK_54945 [Streptomyces sp. NPDC007901]|uniref:hypothetical protein n=1 Tax=Streptomyces sp. NPDC007901 TaxID=3364785 RepID=UPI0036EB04F2
MDAIITSAVAVVGTLAGALLTHLFQLRVAERGERASRSARLRQDRLEACSAFAAVATRLRRAANDRWFRRQESPDGHESFEAADEFYGLRSAAWESYYRLRMVTADPELKQLAEAVINGASAIVDACDHADVRACRDRTSALIEDFVRRAGDLLGAQEY